MRKPYYDVTSTLQIFPGSGNTCTNLRTISVSQFIGKWTLFGGFGGSKIAIEPYVRQADSRDGGLNLEHRVVQNRGAFRFGEDAFADHQLNEANHGYPFRAAVMRVGFRAVGTSVRRLV